jgi:hypothetical protein
VISDLYQFVVPVIGGDGHATRQRDLDPLPQVGLEHRWNVEHVQVVDECIFEAYLLNFFFLHISSGRTLVFYHAYTHFYVSFNRIPEWKDIMDMNT